MMDIHFNAWKKSVNTWAHLLFLMLDRTDQDLVFEFL
jgi:hypothetical protein